MQKQSYKHLKENQWKHCVGIRSEAHTLPKALCTAQIWSTHTSQSIVYSSELKHAQFPKHCVQLRSEAHTLLKAPVPDTHTHTHTYISLYKSITSNTFIDNKATVNFSLAVKYHVSQKLLQWHSTKIYCDTFTSAVSLIATFGNTVVNLHNENNFCSSSLLVSAGGWL